MKKTLIMPNNVPVLVELHSVRGVEDVASTPDKLIEASKEALNNAMNSIYGMAQRVVSKIKELDDLDHPDEIEIKFGLKLNADASVYVVNAGVESQLEVTMKWSKKVTRKRRTNTKPR